MWKLCLIVQSGCSVCIQLAVLMRIQTLLHTANPKLYINNTQTQTVRMVTALFHTIQTTLLDVCTANIDPTEVFEALLCIKTR